MSGWKVGDRVLVNPLNKTKGLMGEMLDGGMAEYCRVAADQLVAMPARRQLRGGGRAAGRLRHRPPHADHPRERQKGDRVLILGASGGVGTGCVILAKQLGAEVIACTRSPEKMRKLKELGADEVINVKEVDFSRWAVEKYGKPQRRSYDGGVDVVINFTGGERGTLRCGASSAAASSWSAAPPPATTRRRICATYGASSSRSSAPTASTTTICRR